MTSQQRFESGKLLNRQRSVNIRLAASVAHASTYAIYTGDRFANYRWSVSGIIPETEYQF
jgi:hypothetical protein